MEMPQPGIEPQPQQQLEPPQLLNTGSSTTAPQENSYVLVLNLPHSGESILGERGRIIRPLIGKESSETFNNLPKVTQLESAESGLKS